MTEEGWGELEGQLGLPAALGSEWGGEPWELYKGLCCMEGWRMGMGGWEDECGSVPLLLFCIL